jgi:hypothetical protein
MKCRHANHTCGFWQSEASRRPSLKDQTPWQSFGWTATMKLRRRSDPLLWPRLAPNIVSTGLITSPAYLIEEIKSQALSSTNDCWIFRDATTPQSIEVTRHETRHVHSTSCLGFVGRCNSTLTVIYDKLGAVRHQHIWYRWYRWWSWSFGRHACGRYLCICCR